MGIVWNSWKVCFHFLFYFILFYFIFIFILFHFVLKKRYLTIAQKKSLDLYFHVLIIRLLFNQGLESRIGNILRLLLVSSWAISGSCFANTQINSMRECLRDRWVKVNFVLVNFLACNFIRMKSSENILQDFSRNSQRTSILKNNTR